MRKKIWRMSEGQFSAVPKIKLEPSVINEVVYQGSTYQGGFSVIFSENNPTKGLCYCDNPYVYVITPAFNEENPNVSFMITAKNLRAGDEVSGNFHIYSEGQTILLPFTIKVEKIHPTCSVGEIKSLEDFLELARRNWKEAFNVFYSNDFAEIMRDAGGENNLIYRGLQKATHCDANIEEFLTATGCKERMSFELEYEKKEYSFIADNHKESIEITRNTWGYIKIDISTDADFVSVENNTVTNDFFLGSKLNINYYIHKDKLHPGKNVCAITFRGMGITRVLTIVVSGRDLHEKRYTGLVKQNKDILRLYKVYEEFRLKRIPASEWTSATISICDEILESEYLKDENFFKLIKTHALVVADEKKRALDYIIRLRSDIEDKRSANWAYLLYLGALLEPQEDYVRRLCNDIESILESSPNNVKAFWFLLFIKKEYVKSPGSKLRSLRHWIMEGFESPILYAECFDIYLDDPYKLEKIDDFSVKILNWAIKRKALTKALAERIIDLIPREEQFSKLKFFIYKSAYDMSRKKDHLKTLVSYLLRHNAKGEPFSSLYKKAIEDNILLTGVFESYIESLPLDYIEPLSDLVLRYFSYDSSISDERKALIFANIVLYKDSDDGIYESNSLKIHQFCIEQMRAGRIDDNLIVCYQDLLENGVVDSKVADAAFNVFFHKKIICLLPDARRVILVEDEFKEPIVSPLIEHRTFLPILTHEYKVFVEMFDGTVTTDENLFFLENTLENQTTYDKLKFIATDKEKAFLHDFSEMEASDELSIMYEDQAKEVLFNEKISEEYIRRKFHIFMGYLREKNLEETILLSLLYKDRFRTYDNGIIIYMIQMLIEREDDKKALDLLLDYVLPIPDRKILLSLLKRVTANPASSKGEFVLELCIVLLREGYHCEETIEYLLRHFIGTCEDMRLIFKYANMESEALDAFLERFLIQGLYSEAIESFDDPIMIAYLEGRANPMIVEAYISYFCHLYLKEDKTPPQSVFAILFRQLRITDSVNDSCRFAYSKYLCGKDELSRQEKDNLALLIDDQLRRNIYFSFYRDMDEELIMKYHLYDKVYIECRWNKGSTLVLTYTRNGEVYKQDMAESYEGIFVKDMVVFFGESIPYSIYDNDNPGEIIQKGELSFSDVGFLNESRFYVINSLKQQLFYKNIENLKEEILSYNDRISAQDDIFDII